MLKNKIDQSIKIEVEVNSFEQFLEAIHTDCDIIMLRNMNEKLLTKCVDHNAEKILETYASQIEEINMISKTGVDFIRVDELTHSFKNMKIELNLNK
jgi:nicotinate-nucleotide pyrophosphorylase (carboxylating)